MYLVDEDDHVGVGLQFLHQGLQTFLELSAILRASHHTRHVEGEDALAEEHRRGMMLGDQLCQSFDDGTLTHTGLTDQDRIVLLPASQDLDDALDLLLTAHAGVEFAFSGRQGEVGAEGVEHGRLRVLLLLSGRRGCVPSLAGSTGTTCVGGLLEVLLILVGQADAVCDLFIRRRIEHRHSVFVIHVVQFQYLFGTVVHCVMQDGEQQVLFIYFRGSLYACLQYGELQDVARFLVEHEVCRMDGHANLVFANPLLQFCLDRLQVQVQPVEQVDDGAITAPEHAQKQVFGSY